MILTIRLVETIRRGRRKMRVLVAYPRARWSLRRLTFDSPYGKLSYLVHPYNETWRYERCVEVPYPRAFLASHLGRGIEIGNVLSHYGSVTHEVFDKYERGGRVTNIDVVELDRHNLDFIVCISTLEHVGWDEPDKDPDKALRALELLRAALAPTGRMLISFRLGHHPTLTDAVWEETIPVDREVFYRQRVRVWDSVSRAEARSCSSIPITTISSGSARFQRAPLELQ